jgi:hypothetical protein
VLVGDDEVVVNEDNVSEMLASTNWKLRKAAYDVLINLAVKKVEGRTPSNDISSSDIHSCIKSALPRMVQDKNPSALDSALRLAFLNANLCAEGCDPDQVTAVVSSIVTGSALSATRPSTAKLVDAVLMKIMEVTREEPSSIHIVSESPLEHGITSKKPKVVIKSVAIILDAAMPQLYLLLKLSQVHPSNSPTAMAMYVIILFKSLLRFAELLVPRIHCLMLSRP